MENPKTICKRFVGMFPVSIAVTIIAFSSHSQSVITQTNQTVIGDDATTMQLPEVAQPGLTVAITNGTQLLITITNGVDFANYELYRRTMLDAGHPWTISATGAQGQTNFIVDMGLSLSFFQVCIGNDWDRDGITNSVDALPADPNVHVPLSIMIDNPTQNGIFQ